MFEIKFDNNEISFFYLKKVTLNLKNAERIGAGSQLTGMRSEVATTGNIEPQFVEVQIACRDVGGLRREVAGSKSSSLFGVITFIYSVRLPVCGTNRFSYVRFRQAT
uniref:(northern house mosquito) hypothetical protein n=1 Tax=Culex pipiens TaxID=7175 RepID=A0A8D8MKF1_CULPI